MKNLTIGRLTGLLLLNLERSDKTKGRNFELLGQIVGRQICGENSGG